MLFVLDDWQYTLLVFLFTKYFLVITIRKSKQKIIELDLFGTVNIYPHLNANTKCEEKTENIFTHCLKYWWNFHKNIWSGLSKIKS